MRWFGLDRAKWKGDSHIRSLTSLSHSSCTCATSIKNAVYKCENPMPIEEKERKKRVNTFRKPMSKGLKECDWIIRIILTNEESKALEDQKRRVRHTLLLCIRGKRTNLCPGVSIGVGTQ
jgi:hypothetical protein